jgi:hypothetical protein
VDNPLAANVIPIGDTPNGAGGRGMRTDSHTSWFLVRAGAWDRVGSATLTRVSPPPIGAVPGPNQFQLIGIPREDVIDVISLGDSPGYRALMATTSLGDVQPCDPALESVFDRSPAPISDYRTPVASRRRSIGRTADGRLILMRTRTSARDIEAVSALRERFP